MPGLGRNVNDLSKIAVIVLKDVMEIIDEEIRIRAEIEKGEKTMSTVLIFVSGMFLGAFFAVLIMSIMIAGDDDR